MTGPSRRKSIHIGGFKHANPIPNARNPKRNTTYDAIP